MRSRGRERERERERERGGGYKQGERQTIREVHRDGERREMI